MKLRGIWCLEFAEIDSLTRSETGVSSRRFALARSIGSATHLSA